MHSLIFDVETTGLTKQDEVIQFSGLLIDDEFDIKKIYNFYCETDRQSCPAALAVHRLDQKILHTLSKGKTFEEQFFPLYEELRRLPDLTWASYGYSFDTRMIYQTIQINAGIQLHFPDKDAAVHSSGQHGFCVMDMCTNFVNSGIRRKNHEMAMHPKVLHNIYENFGIKDSLIRMGVSPDNKQQMQDVIDRLFSIITKNVPSKNITLHDALYDCFLTFLTYRTFSMMLKR